jgi:hypothetical protein
MFLPEGLAPTAAHFTPRFCAGSSLPRVGQMSHNNLVHRRDMNGCTEHGVGKFEASYDFTLKIDQLHGRHGLPPPSAA